HMLASHIATLAYYSDNLPPEYISADYVPVIKTSIISLKNAAAIIESKNKPGTVISETDQNQVSLLDKRVNALMLERQKELEQGQLETSTRKALSVFKSITDQFYFIYKTCIDIEKISKKIKSPEIEKVPATTIVV
ncbi:MAG TPA: hypothetical protein VK616_15710, partial [Flavitalea sp.]|nr:hypothetical protein [Flavitalea sp.]